MWLVIPVPITMLALFPTIWVATLVLTKATTAMAQRHRRGLRGGDVNVQ